MNTRQMARRAHAVFVSQGWTYFDAGIPSVERVQEIIDYLVRNVREGLERNPMELGEKRYCETGRIRVEADFYEGDSEPELRVFLDLAEWEDYD